MCGGGEVYMVSVSSGGQGTRVILEDREWEVTMPSHLHNKGKCMITVLNPQVSCDTDLLAAGQVESLRVHSSLPIQGYDLTVSEVGQPFTNYGTLFYVDTKNNDNVTAVGLQNYFPGSIVPYTMRCTGIPTVLRFKTQKTAFETGANTGWADIAVSDTGVQFDLRIEFDKEELEEPPKKRKR